MNKSKHCFNVRKIETQLDTLLKDLEQTYERILARITRTVQLNCSKEKQVTYTDRRQSPMALHCSTLR